MRARRSTSRASISPRRPNGASRRARRSASDVVLGIDYHHRLSVAEAASFCQKMPSGTLDFLEEPIRDESPKLLRGAAPADRHSLRDRRGVRLEVAVPALYRARHPSVQSPRRLQCRRPDGVDEGRRLERDPLRRHDAAQSARAGLHGGDHPFLRGGCELLLARNARKSRRKRISASTIRTSSRSSRGSKARTTRCPMRPALASRSTRS